MGQSADQWAKRLQDATGIPVAPLSRPMQGERPVIRQQPDGLYLWCPLGTEETLRCGPIPDGPRAEALAELWETLCEGKAGAKPSSAQAKEYSNPSLERELIGRVHIGDRSGARRILNQLLARVFLTTSGNLDILKARVLELIAFLSRAAAEGGVPLETLLGEGYGQLNALSQEEEYEGVCAFVVQALDRFIDAVYSARNPLTSEHLGKITEYIHQHFGQELSLEDAAAQAPISPYYLSHLFRQELGMTFSEYLTKVRLEEARRLLSDTDLRIGDVAMAVGYGDAGYFSRVFRKAAGCTPAEYRRAFRSP